MATISREALRARAKQNTENAKAKENDPSEDNLTKRIVQEVKEDKETVPVNEEPKPIKQEKTEKPKVETPKKDKREIKNDIESSTLELLALKRKKKRIPVSLYLEEDLNKTLTEMAEKNGVTKSDLITIALKKALGLD